MAQMVFERFETKYILNRVQYESLLAVLNGKMVEDKYGAYTISNIYYDTEQYDLIRASIAKPVYKEKLRLRCYGQADSDTKVFLELKKKFKKRVYKRRIVFPYGRVQDFPFNNTLDKFQMFGQLASPNDRQIAAEIGHFLRLYAVEPKVFLRYDRLALSGVEDPGLRITFDSGIRCRQNDIRLDAGGYGTPVLDPAKVLMEIKVPLAIPLWLSHLLSKYGIFPVSFSKYGTCYTDFILNRQLIFLQQQMAA